MTGHDAQSPDDRQTLQRERSVRPKPCLARLAEMNEPRNEGKPKRDKDKSSDGESQSLAR
jgi:hypothetical protein